MTPDQQELWGRKVAAITMAEREGRLLAVEPELARAVQDELERLKAEVVRILDLNMQAVLLIQEHACRVAELERKCAIASDDRVAALKQVDRLRDELASARARVDEEVEYGRRLRAERREMFMADIEHRRAARELGATRAEPSRPEAPVLRWTDRKPTEPDWYWVRGGWAGDGVVVYVEFYPGLLDPVILAFGASDRKVPARAEWAGPVPRPIPRSQRDVDDPS